LEAGAAFYRPGDIPDIQEALTKRQIAFQFFLEWQRQPVY